MISRLLSASLPTTLTISSHAAAVAGAILQKGSKGGSDEPVLELRPASGLPGPGSSSLRSPTPVQSDHCPARPLCTWSWGFSHMCLSSALSHFSDARMDGQVSPGSPQVFPRAAVTLLSMFLSFLVLCVIRSTNEVLCRGHSRGWPLISENACVYTHPPLPTSGYGWT